MIDIKTKGFKKYFANTSWLLFERILRIIAGLVVGIWVARYLGVEQFGLLNYAISFVGLFSIFASFGLDSIVVKDLIKYKNKQHTILGTSFFIKILGALLVFGLLYLTSTYNDKTSQKLIYIIAFGILFQSLNVIDFYFQSKVLSKYTVYANIISLLISSILKLYFIYIGAKLEFFAFVYSIDTIILSIGLIYFYIKKDSILKWKFDINIAKELLSQSWPIILTGFVSAIYMKIDQVMLKNMLGNHEVGLYAAAVRLSEAWYFIPVLVCSSLFPAIVNAKKNSEKLYYERLQKLFNFLAISSLIIIIPTLFLSDWIIELLYGKEYIGASLILKIHIVSGIFVALGVGSTQWVLNEGLQKNGSLRTFLGAVLNVILNLILIKSYGALGAAISTLISYIFVNYLSLAMFSKTKVCFKMQSKALFFNWKI